mmetsp:Transcript_65748/g.189200  ORF Transcript_65748/g.189200 Transcript_65748/m.189200 type:complete len:286 (-) Transcript_65748:225-1082(-)
MGAPNRAHVDHGNETLNFTTNWQTEGHHDVVKDGSIGLLAARVGLLHQDFAIAWLDFVFVVQRQNRRLGLPGRGELHKSAGVASLGLAKHDVHILDHPVGAEHILQGIVSDILRQIADEELRVGHVPVAGLATAAPLSAVLAAGPALAAAVSPALLVAARLAATLAVGIVPATAALVAPADAAAIPRVDLAAPAAAGPIVDLAAPAESGLAAALAAALAAWAFAVPGAAALALAAATPGFAAGPAALAGVAFAGALLAGPSDLNRLWGIRPDLVNIVQDLDGILT